MYIQFVIHQKLTKLINENATGNKNDKWTKAFRWIKQFS